MIYKIDMYACKCDKCGKGWYDEHNGFMAFADKDIMHENVDQDDSWLQDGEIHYCEECTPEDEE